MADIIVAAPPLSIPEQGSEWTHKKGTIYLVLETSAPSDDPADTKFPVTVLYMGPDGRIWPRTLPRWHEGMTFARAPRYRAGSLLSRLYLAWRVWSTRRANGQV